MSDLRLTLHPAARRQPVLIPLASDSVKAGFPSPSENYLAPEIDLNDLLIHHREATFYVRISGSYSVLYGSLSIIAIGMLWLYICICILFYGSVLGMWLEERRASRKA